MVIEKGPILDDAILSLQARNYRKLDIMSRRRLARYVGGVVLFLVAFVGSLLWRSTNQRVIGPSSEQVEIDRLNSRTELLMVYIGKKNCAASSQLASNTVDSMRSYFRGRADRADRAFVTMGVALDWQVSDGLDHLERLGPFDQVSAGGNWANSSTIKYLWGELGGEAATPQFLIVKRRRIAPVDNPRSSSYALANERIVRRIVGLDGIRRFLAQH